MTEGSDTYFEEQRAYQAYPRLRNPGWIRGAGIAMILAIVIKVILTIIEHH